MRAPICPLLHWASALPAYSKRFGHYLRILSDFPVVSALSVEQVVIIPHYLLQLHPPVLLTEARLDHREAAVSSLCSLAAGFGAA